MGIGCVLLNLQNSIVVQQPNQYIGGLPWTTGYNFGVKYSILIGHMCIYALRITR